MLLHCYRHSGYWSVYRLAGKLHTIVHVVLWCMSHEYSLRQVSAPFSLLLEQAVKRFGKVRKLFDSSEPLQTTVKHKQRVLSKSSVWFDQV